MEIWWIQPRYVATVHTGVRCGLYGFCKTESRDGKERECNENKPTQNTEISKNQTWTEKLKLAKTQTKLKPSVQKNRTQMTVFFV